MSRSRIIFPLIAPQNKKYCGSWHLLYRIFCIIPVYCIVFCIPILKTLASKVLLWIRIRIGSGFNCCVDPDSYPDWTKRLDPDPGLQSIRIQNPDLLYCNGAFICSGQNTPPSVCGYRVRYQIWNTGYASTLNYTSKHYGIIIKLYG
jgi:hypothetical protein